MNQMEEKLRQAAKAEASGMAGCMTTPSALAFSDRLRDRYAYRMEHIQRTTQIGELLGLLDKHPEIARMFDLIDALGRE